MDGDDSSRPGRRPFGASLLGSVAHNLGVVGVGFGVAWLGTRIDAALGLPALPGPWPLALGAVLVAAGFLLRVWATHAFYERRMKVISLEPQGTLVTGGPYRFTRNPLYLGGNVFVFLGAGLLQRSPGALAVTILHLPLVDLFVRREERQLERRFGDEWVRYRSRVRRWL